MGAITNQGVPVRRRLAAPSDPQHSASYGMLLFSAIPLLFLIYWFFRRRMATPVKRSRKQSTYRCHYPENAEDFSDVDPAINMVYTNNYDSKIADELFCK